jgi:hypothetical protein
MPGQTIMSLEQRHRELNLAGWSQLYTIAQGHKVKTNGFDSTQQPPHDIWEGVIQQVLDIEFHRKP